MTAPMTAPMANKTGPDKIPATMPNPETMDGIKTKMGPMAAATAALMTANRCISGDMFDNIPMALDTMTDRRSSVGAIIAPIFKATPSMADVIRLNAPKVVASIVAAISVAAPLAVSYP